MARKFDMGVFLGSNFGPGIFLGFDFCPHSTIPVTWKPEYSPPPGVQDYREVNRLILVIVDTTAAPALYIVGQ